MVATVVAAGALALEACPACPPLDACEMRYESTADGGLLVTAVYADGAVSDASCPPVPEGCPVA